MYTNQSSLDGRAFGLRSFLGIELKYGPVQLHAVRILRGPPLRLCFHPYDFSKIPASTDLMRGGRLIP